MPIDLPYHSRFKNTDPILFDGVETFGAWTQPSFLNNVPASAVITFAVTAEYEGRPDLISNRFYNTTLLDWVIIAFNAPRDVFNWPRAGTTIKIPHYDVVVPGID